MKTTPFRHVAVRSLDEAYGLLAEFGESAKIIAGGQSLVPMMNFRMVSPDVLIDLNHLTELRAIVDEGDHLRIGALTRHRDVETNEHVKAHAPLLSLAVQNVAHQAVRNRGTFGGSLCHADPAAEFPACAVLLGMTMELGSTRGVREVAAADFFLGVFATEVQPDEVLIAVRVPKCHAGDRFAFRELSRRHGDFAIAGVAAQRYAATTPSDVSTRWVVFGVADHPVPLPAIAKLGQQGLPGLKDEKVIAAAIAVDLDGLVNESENSRFQSVLATELVLRCAQDLFDVPAEAH